MVRGLSSQGSVPKRLIFAGSVPKRLIFARSVPKRLIFVCSVPKRLIFAFFPFWEPQRSVPKRLIFAYSVPKRLIFACSVPKRLIFAFVSFLGTPSGLSSQKISGLSSKPRTPPGWPCPWLEPGREHAELCRSREKTVTITPEKIKAVRKALRKLRDAGYSCMVSRAPCVWPPWGRCRYSLSPRVVRLFHMSGWRHLGALFMFQAPLRFSRDAGRCAG